MKLDVVQEELCDAKTTIHRLRHELECKLSAMRLLKAKHTTELVQYQTTMDAQLDSKMTKMNKFLGKFKKVTRKMMLAMRLVGIPETVRADDPQRQARELLQEYATEFNDAEALEGLGTGASAGGADGAGGVVNLEQAWRMEFGFDSDGDEDEKLLPLKAVRNYGDGRKHATHGAGGADGKHVRGIAAVGNDEKPQAVKSKPAAAAAADTAPAPVAAPAAVGDDSPDAGEVESKVDTPPGVTPQQPPPAADTHTVLYVGQSVRLRLGACAVLQRRRFSTPRAQQKLQVPRKLLRTQSSRSSAMFQAMADHTVLPQDTDPWRRGPNGSVLVYAHEQAFTVVVDFLRTGKMVDTTDKDLLYGIYREATAFQVPVRAALAVNDSA